MSTRSYITMKTEDGYKGIYCHFNGHPEHNGKILKNHYQDAEKVKTLIELGSLSLLDENIGEKIKFEDSETRTQNKQCLAYHRDRGENLKIQTFKNKEDLMEFTTDCWAEYTYIFENNCWKVFNNKGYEVIMEEDQ